MADLGVEVINAAYAHCEALTRKRESNFSLGFALLGPEKKRAIHVVYAFCRFVDDVSDESGPADATELLGRWTGELDRIYNEGTSEHPIGIALLDVLKTYPIPRDGFQDLIDGCVRDQLFKRYPDFDTLAVYCDLVATSIAKVSLPVYGVSNPLEAFPFGRDLSFAFQLTNVLRDISEDLERGRVYVPEEDFKRFGLSAEAVVAGGDPGVIRRFYEFQGERCEAYFRSGLKVLPYLEPDTRPCVRAMWGAYHTLLEKILKDPLKALEAQTVLTAEDKERIVAQSRSEEVFSYTAENSSGCKKGAQTDAPKTYLSKMNDFGEVCQRQHSAYGSEFVRRMADNGGLFVSGETGAQYMIPTHFGFCYGVEKSIDLAFETVRRFSDRRIFLTHDVIHNPKVNQDLKDKNVTVLPKGPDGRPMLDEVKQEDVVIVSAFGGHYCDMETLASRGCVIVDTTCGAIVRVWKRVEAYAKAGATAIIHGVWNHEETRATASQAVKFGGQFLIIRDEKEAARIGDYLEGKIDEAEFLKAFEGKMSKGFNPAVSLKKIGISSQTTMFRSETLRIQEYLKKLYGRVYGADGSIAQNDTICSATQERQDALARMMGKKLDLVIIIGGFNSSNTTHLSEIAEERYPTYHIQGPEDIFSAGRIRHLNPSERKVRESHDWLPGHSPVVGIGTGASTPDVLIENVIKRIEECLKEK